MPKVTPILFPLLDKEKSGAHGENGFTQGESRRAYPCGVSALALRAQFMATTLATVESREVLRCERCQLVQFRTVHGNCRRCLKPLEPEEPVAAPIHLHNREANGSPELDVARSVRTLRHARDLSQRQLAARMQVPRTYISKIENGKAMPTLSSLERLAAALDAPIGDLLYDARSERDSHAVSMAEDPFLSEMLPFVGHLNSFQQQVLLSHARDMAREATSGRYALARA